MPWNSRITEKRHLAEIAGNISSTDAHPMHPHDGVSRRWPRRRVNLNSPPRLRLLKLQSFHDAVVGLTGAGDYKVGRASREATLMFTVKDGVSGESLRLHLKAPRA